MDDLNPLAGTAHLLEEVDSKSIIKKMKFGRNFEVILFRSCVDSNF